MSSILHFTDENHKDGKIWNKSGNVPAFTPLRRQLRLSSRSHWEPQGYCGGGVGDVLQFFLLFDFTIKFTKNARCSKLSGVQDQVLFFVVEIQMQILVMIYKSTSNVKQTTLRRQQITMS